MQNQTYSTLSAINVNDKTEKKGNQTYLSWAYAWAEVKKHFPGVQRKVYEDPSGNNYFTDGKTCWVKVGVEIDGIEHIDYLPIMDMRNNAIPLERVTSFDVNKAIQRSATKAIAMHGLGLYIYAGEDLPIEERSEPSEANGLGIVMDALAKLDGWPLLALQAQDEGAFKQAFSRLNTKQKALHRELEQAAAQARLEYQGMFEEAFNNQDEMSAIQLMDELTTSERKALVWAVLNTNVKTWLKQVKEKA